jgi:hypothetical protein
VTPVYCTIVCVDSLLETLCDRQSYRGLQEGIVVEEEDGEEVTIDSRDNTKESFDYNTEEDIESKFDEEEDSDEEEGDYFID